MKRARFEYVNGSGRRVCINTFPRPISIAIRLLGGSVKAYRAVSLAVRTLRVAANQRETCIVKEPNRNSSHYT